MTSRRLPSLRHALAVLLAIFLTAGFAFLSARAADRVPGAGRKPGIESMPDMDAAHVLPSVSLAQSASLTVSPDALTESAMPVVRDVRALQNLRRSLRSEDLHVRQRAAHRVASLSTDPENVPYLKNLRPILQEIAFDEEADEGVRLLALSALYRTTPKRALYLILRERVEKEPSARVRHAMERMIEGAWEPKPVSVPA